MLESIHTYFQIHVLGVPFIALLTAILVKGIVQAIGGKWTLKGMLGSGNMPSVHSALVIGLLSAIGLKYGIYHDLFLICLVFAVITTYDAINVRYQAGLHAKALNRLIPNNSETFDESIGHTPLEALVGGVIGFLTALILLGV